MTDWKDTPEGRAAAQKYGDSLPLSRPEPSRKHPRMPLGSRAKIFSPFAAPGGPGRRTAASSWCSSPATPTTCSTGTPWAPWGIS